jgi:type IV pilus assembly protein PilX
MCAPLLSDLVFEGNVMSRISPLPRSRTRQRGVVLAVGLILLLVMSLVMVVAMSGSILQERMAGALRNESIADAGADSALRDGELWVWNQIQAQQAQLTVPGPSGAFPMAVDDPVAKLFRSSYGWEPGGNQYGTAGSGIAFTADPYYTMAETPAFIVELLGDVSPGSDGQDKAEAYDEGANPGSRESLYYYRITGRSTGGSDGVVRAVQSTFSVSLF